MYVRVVRFTDVTPEQMAEVTSQIEDSDGPPEGVPSTGVKVLYDASQGTAVVLQDYASEEDMREGAKVFEQMDASETPGSRASVDHCELRVERELS